jgi:hypothetical protein
MRNLRVKAKKLAELVSIPSVAMVILAFTGYGIVLLLS